MRIIVDYLAEGENYVPSKQKIVHLEALLLMLRALTGDNRFEEIIPDMQEEQERTGGINMCELLDKYERKGMEAGIVAGANKLGKLITILMAEGKSDAVMQVANDEKVRESYYEQYGM